MTDPLFSNPAVLVLRVPSAPDMKQLGFALGAAMKAGDVVGLSGELGAGKTTLAQGIAAGLAVPADRAVTSPTFALVNEHPGRVPFVHADFYRLRNILEAAELGLDELFATSVVAIEWIDRFPQLVPEDHLAMNLRCEGGPEGAHAGSRLVSLRGNGPRAQALMAAVQAAVPSLVLLSA